MFLLDTDHLGILQQRTTPESARLRARIALRGRRAAAPESPTRNSLETRAAAPGLSGFADLCKLGKPTPTFPMHSELRPAVFLDRDGVLNRTTVRDGTPYPPVRVEEVEILPGVAGAIKRLAEHGLPLIVVTNQPDVARGSQSRQTVEAINAAIARALPELTAFYVCYHDNADRCDCRKPGAGLLKRAAAEHGIDLSRSFMVGDRWSDVVAGAAAGCKTFLLDVPYSQCHRCTPDHVVADLSEAAERILSLPPARRIA